MRCIASSTRHLAMPSLEPEDAPGRASAGCLYVVSTPIGNLEDLSARARSTLERCDAVLCEDTRHSGRLLAHLGLKKPLLSLHEHNERKRLDQVLERFQGGEHLALISDAGTPLLSDPGFLVVRACAEQGVRVVPVPGASALLTALVVSGLPPHPFTFAGFAPPKSGKRRSYLERFASLSHTVVFYESPHRIQRFLADAIEIFGAERPAVLGRELTKMHEEVLRGSLGTLEKELAARPSIRGEFVVVLGG